MGVRLRLSWAVWGLRTFVDGETPQRFVGPSFDPYAIRHAQKRDGRGGVPRGSN